MSPDGSEPRGVDALRCASASQGVFVWTPSFEHLDRDLKMVNDQTLPDVSGIAHERTTLPIISLRPLSYTFVVFSWR